MTKSPQKNVPDVGIELGAACMPSGYTSDRATSPSQLIGKYYTDVKVYDNNNAEAVVAAIALHVLRTGEPKMKY